MIIICTLSMNIYLWLTKIISNVSIYEYLGNIIENGNQHIVNTICLKRSYFFITCVNNGIGVYCT